MKKIGISFIPMTEKYLAKIKAAAPGFEYYVTEDFHDEKLLDCEIVFGSMSPRLIAQSTKLKWIHLQWAGVDGILGSRHKFPDHVILTNSSGSYGVTISEYLLTMTLMLMRNMRDYILQQEQKIWHRITKEQSIYASTVCVIGLGNIGENYAKRCKALGAKRVTGVVRTAKDVVPSCVDELYTVNEIENAVKDADVVAICLPGTSETKNLVNEALLLKMKKGVLILNIGRGIIIDTQALIAQLNSGHIGGAALDVTEPEPLPQDSPLWSMPNVIITPHMSGHNSLDTTNDLGVEKFVDYLEDYVANKPLKRVVDKTLGY